MKILYNPQGMENEAVEVREFRPELLPRRGERVAWSLAGLALVAWIVLALLAKPIFIGFKLLAVLLLLSALAISLGNWTDRRTRLRIEPQGVLFENGLRKTQLRWEEIRTVEVYPSNMGDKVRVLGEQSHFNFRTLGEVRMRGELKGLMGFADGEQILRQILRNAHLKDKRQAGDVQYYSRE